MSVRHDLQQAAGELQLPLDGLVRVRHGGHVDAGAVQLRPLPRPPQDLDRVLLDAHPLAPRVTLRRVPREERRVAIRAPERAARVRVQREVVLLHESRGLGEDLRDRPVLHVGAAGSRRPGDDRGRIRALEAGEHRGRSVRHATRLPARKWYSRKGHCVAVSLQAHTAAEVFRYSGGSARVPDSSVEGQPAHPVGARDAPCIAVHKPQVDLVALLYSREAS